MYLVWKVICHSDNYVRMSLRQRLFIDVSYFNDWQFVAFNSFVILKKMFYFWRNKKWSVRYWRTIGFEWFWMKVILFEIPMPCRCKRAALWRMRSSGFYLVSSLSVLEVLSLHYCSFPTIILELCTLCCFTCLYQTEYSHWHRYLCEKRQGHYDSVTNFKQW